MPYLQEQQLLLVSMEYLEGVWLFLLLQVL